VARNFDGSDDVATNSSALSNFVSATTGTIACWYRPVGSPANHASATNALDCIVGETGGLLGLFRGTIAGANDKIYAYNWDGNDDRVGFSYTVNEWVHCAWRHTGANLYVYKNGAEMGSVASGTTTGLTGTIQVGHRSIWGYLEGDLAEMAFWNVALSADDEIPALGKGFSPMMVRPASLTAYWPMWGRQSTTIEQDVFRGRDLTLSGTGYAEHPPRIIYPTRPRSPVAGVFQNIVGSPFSLAGPRGLA